MIICKNIEKTYVNGRGKHASTVHALKGISLRIKKGEFVIIRGGSGSGKTTLLQLLGGLMAPSKGSISLDGVAMESMDDNALSHMRGNKMGFIFQDYNLIDHLSVLDNVMVPGLFASKSHGDLKQRAMALLKKVGLESKMHERPPYLSGGQKQRVAIARALLLKPGMILADEPTGNLDQETGHQIEELLYQLSKEEKVTVLLVSHEESYHKHADRLIGVEFGQIVEDEKLALS